MIVDKKTKKVISGNSLSLDSNVSQEIEVEGGVEVLQQMPSNGPIEVLNAMKEILKSVTWEYGVANSPKIFKTVQVDDGQYERIANGKINTEETLGFPAAFVHFIDWRYLTSAKRFNEGRAEVRIRFVMNRLNPHDEEGGADTEVYYVANRIHQTIQESIPKYPCLQERCILSYVDPMEHFHNGLQPCWLTYEVWFKETNIWYSRKRIQKYVVFPPFANHSDQDKTIENINPDNHTNLDHPRTYEEATGFVYNIPLPDESESET